MFVLGIDPGLTRTGYGVVEVSATRARVVATGVFRTDRSGDTGSRLLELHRDLGALVDEFRPGEAAIEEVFVNRNLQTATSVGRASGVVLLTLAGKGVPITEYTPSAVKMALTGYGAADKEQVGRVVAMRLALAGPPQPSDAADALAIALCHIQSIPYRKAVSAAEGERSA